MVNQPVRPYGWQTRAIWVSPRLTMAIVLSLTLALPSHAQTFSVLHEFSGETDGKYPQAGLVRDAAGNLYGTTQYGGDPSCSFSGDGCGTVFKTDTNGNETILYRFVGRPDGSQPMAGLIVDSNGNLYGTIVYGGISDVGTVFKVDTSGQETVLYSFGPLPDGEIPSGGLIMDADGNIYGTTQEGGASKSCWGGCGTIFKVDRTGKETVLVNFRPAAEYPTAGLTMDAAGDFYGTTSGNGYCCLGTVFKTRNDIPAASTVYTFTGGTGGATPVGGIVRDLKGQLYGTTYVGGDLNCANSLGYGCGVVYEIGRHSKETVLHSFAGTPEGAFPDGGLLRDRAGTLYGTTMLGGSSDFGTVFKLDKRGKMTVLHSFTNADGAIPESTLIQDAAGNLYGTTRWGGNFLCDSQYGHGCKVVFKLTP